MSQVAWGRCWLDSRCPWTHSGGASRRARSRGGEPLGPWVPKAEITAISAPPTRKCPSEIEAQVLREALSKGADASATNIRGLSASPRGGAVRDRFSESSMSRGVARSGITLSGRDCWNRALNGGDDRDRTCDLFHVKGMHYRCATSPHRPLRGSLNEDHRIVQASQRMMRSAYPVKGGLFR